MNIPILNLRLAPFVQCPNCKAYNEYGKKKVCSDCNAELVFDEDSPLQLFLLNTGANYHPYTPFVKCPNCSRLLAIGVERCPDCYEELSEEYAFTSAFNEVMKTIACDYARSITGANVFAVIVVLISIGMFAYSIFTYFPVSLVMPLLSLPPLLSTLIWYYRFGGAKLDDDEYQTTRIEVGRSFKLWLIIFGAQLFILYLLNVPH